MIQRRFLIAPSLARLIERERNVTDRVVDGFFPQAEHRVHFVRVGLERAELILMTRTDAEWQTEAVEVPRIQGAALIEVSSGHVAYDRVLVPIAEEQTAILDRLFEPDRVDLLTVDFETREDAERFTAPAWFGREVTQVSEFTTAAIALGARPQFEEEVSNGALLVLLDALEGHFAGQEPAGQEQGARQEQGPSAATQAPMDPMKKGSYTRRNLRPPHQAAEDDLDQVIRELASITAGNDVRQGLV